MSRRYTTSESPFYDKEFAKQTIKRPGQRTLRASVEPPRYSANISCTECATPARIETRPSKTIYRCPGCQNLLATIHPSAEVTVP